MSEPSDTDTPEPGDEDEAEAPRPRPRPKKKRKKKRAPKKRAAASAGDPADDAPEDDAPEDDAPEDDAPDSLPERSDVEAPLPGEGTPDGDRLRAAHRAFAVGDYGAVRKIARALEDTATPEVASAAKALRKRVEIDPVQVVVLSSCAAVVAAIVYVWIL